MYLEAIPIINKSKFSYIRKENDGFFTFRLTSGHDTGTQLMNTTAMEILSLCDGKNNIQSIVTAFKEKYSDIDISELSNDIKYALKYMTNQGLLRWKKGYPFQDQSLEIFKELHDGLKISMFREELYPAIMQFLSRYGLPGEKLRVKMKNEESIAFLMPFVSGTSFDKFNIGSDTMKSKETIFLLLNSNDEIEGLLRFIFPLRMKFVRQCTIASLTAIILKDLKHLDCLPPMFDFCSEKIRHLYSGNEAITKIRTVFTKSSLVEYGMLLKYLEKSGFSKECELQKEINLENIVFFAKKIQ